MDCKGTSQTESVNSLGEPSAKRFDGVKMRSMVKCGKWYNSLIGFAIDVTRRFQLTVAENLADLPW